jgi:predicted Zn-dependent peptidase
LDVLSNILFEGKNSRAHRKLVDERGTLLSISGSAFTPTYPGLFIITGVLKGNKAAAQAEKELTELINRVQTQGVTEEEVQIAVKQLTVQLVDSVRTPFGLGQLIGTVQMIFDDPKRFADDLSKYTRVTAAEVQSVAQKYLHPNNRSVVTLERKQ